MSEYKVNLDIFAGPMDLLLYLVRREEVDIYEIPIARITEQYLKYIEMLKSLDIDVAGDFLVMASTLLQIKSAMLLPKSEIEDIENEDPDDPRAVLIRQLLEYKKFKDAANMLDTSARKRDERHGRPPTIIDQLKENDEPELDLDQVSVWDLLEAFDSILKATGGMVYDVSHIHDDTPIDLYQIEILHRLQQEGPMRFERIFESPPNKIVMVGMFLALLELIRESLIWVEQADGSEHLFVKALTDEPAEQAVQKAIMNNAVAAEESPDHIPADEPERIETEAESDSERTTDQFQPDSAENRRPPIAIEEIPPQKHTTATHEQIPLDN